jgi:hypothetical protein
LWNLDAIDNYKIVHVTTPLVHRRAARLPTLEPPVMNIERAVVEFDPALVIQGTGVTANPTLMGGSGAHGVFQNKRDHQTDLVRSDLAAVDLNLLLLHPRAPDFAKRFVRSRDTLNDCIFEALPRSGADFYNSSD